MPIYNDVREMMGAERRSRAATEAFLRATEQYPPQMILGPRQMTAVNPRTIDETLLDQFTTWAGNAPMFNSSPEGAAFGKELMEAFRLARIGLAQERRST